MLMAKLIQLKPIQREGMESFLLRCQALKDEFDSYGVDLQDSLLITQVLRTLSLQWRRSAGIEGETSLMTWVQVSEQLLTEDNARKQSKRDASDALLPLGYVRGREAGAASSQGTSGPPAQAAATTGQKAGGGRPQSPYRGRSNSPARTPGGSLVCFCCLRSGHVHMKCPTKPEGWRLTPEQRSKAEAVRTARMEQSSADRTSAAAVRAHQLKDVSQGEASAAAGKKVAFSGNEGGISDPSI